MSIETAWKTAFQELTAIIQYNSLHSIRKDTQMLRCWAIDYILMTLDYTMVHISNYPGLPN